jgi:arylsulfatase A-like enzyme
LLIADTLRADHLGAYGYDRPTSPALDRWAGQGALFERVWATSPWTLPSIGSMLSGQIPNHHGAGLAVDSGAGRSFASFRPDVPALAPTLAEAGFATAAIVNNPFLLRRFGLARGFETWEYVFRSYDDHPRSDELVDWALAWLGERDERPFFLMMNFFDPHLPYDPGSSSKGLFTRDYAGALSLPFAGYEDQNRHWVPESVADRGFVSAAYDEEIRYLDGQIDRLLMGLAERGLSEETLVVVVSDHGEEFFEHDSFEHGHSLYDEVLRVPLLVLGPGVRAQRLNTPVSITDLFPTILESLELEIPPRLAGQSLWPLLVGGEPSGIEDRALVAEVPLHGPRQWALVRWPWKVVMTAGATPRLFDLAQDPGEKIDRADREPERIKALMAELAGIQRRARSERGQRAAVSLDAETRQQLEGLGYLEKSGEGAKE